MRICLMGFMGSGKSTIGLELAEALRYRYVDTDALISDKMKMDIPSIFKHHGEDRFRSEELISIKESVDLDNVIISTGGGLPCNEEIIDIINKNTQAYYIYIRPSVLAERLWKLSEMDSRPLLNNVHSKSELESFIKNRILQRERYYFESHGLIDGDQDVKEIVQDIIRLLPMTS